MNQDTRERMERVIANQYDNRDLVFIGTAMKQFKETDAYGILMMNNQATIENMLSTGRIQPSPAEYHLGRMEGIQAGFKDVVDALVNRGEEASLRLDAETEDSVQDEDEKIEEEVTASPATIQTFKKRGRPRK